MIVETFSKNEWQKIFNTLRQIQRKAARLKLFSEEERNPVRKQNDGWTAAEIDEWLLRRFLRRLAVAGELGMAFDYHLKRGRQHKMRPCPELKKNEDAGIFSKRELWPYLATIERNCLSARNVFINNEMLEKLQILSNFVAECEIELEQPETVPLSN